jgi:hypothetical protein
VELLICHCHSGNNKLINVRGECLELLDTFSHIQFNGLNTTPGSANFGYLTPTQYNSPRSMRYSLCLDF